MKGVERIQLLLSRPRVHLKGLEDAVREVIDDARQEENLDRVEYAIRLLNADSRGAAVGGALNSLRTFLAREVTKEEKLEGVFRIPLLVQGIVSVVGTTWEGDQIRAVADAWIKVVTVLRNDPEQAYRITARQWEELLAAAFDEAGYDEVVLTPRSRDLGRDVIATKIGVGSVRIIGSMKAFKPGHLVTHDDVRALLGVLAADHGASKGILTTTSDFAPTITEDPLIRPHLPYRLELLNGKKLLRWLSELLG